MSKETQKLEKELREVALEIIDDIDLTDELEDKYACFISKELYDEFLKINDKINELNKNKK